MSSDSLSYRTTHRHPSSSNSSSSSSSSSSQSSHSSSLFSPRMQNVILVCLFATAVTSMYLLFSNLPKLEDGSDITLKFPRSLDDVRDLSQLLRRYKEEHFTTVLITYAATYIFLQSFAIPGAVFLSILAGPLFGTYWGLIIVSFVASSGSSICYFLSKSLASHIVQRSFPTMIESFRQKIQSHRHNLFFYLLFLRISPLLPNWFISLSSPILNIPFFYFFFATFFGLMPANYIHVCTGIQLEEIGNGSSTQQGGVNIKSLLFLFCFAFLALIPTLCRNKMQEMEHNMAQKTEVEEEEDEERRKVK